MELFFGRSWAVFCSFWFWVHCQKKSAGADMHWIDFRRVGMRWLRPWLLVWFGHCGICPCLWCGHFSAWMGVPFIGFLIKFLASSILIHGFTTIPKRVSGRRFCFTGYIHTLPKCWIPGWHDLPSIIGLECLPYVVMAFIVVLIWNLGRWADRRKHWGLIDNKSDSSDEVH